MSAVAAQPRLKVLAGGKKSRLDGECQVAAQAVMTGIQDQRVTCMTAEVTGRGHGVLTIRVGRVLLHLHDLDALHSWVVAIQRAIELQDRAFASELGPFGYQPASTQHKP